MWIPQILDVEAQEKDRAKFAILHGVTANLAEPLFIAKFQGFAAMDLAEGYLSDVTTLAKFLSAEPGQELSAAITGLQAELQAFLEKPLSVRELERADRALAEELSLEFAGAMWATLIPALRAQTSEGEHVDPAILLPVDLTDGRTAVLDKVLENGSHFEVEASDLNRLMAQLLQELTTTALVSEGTMQLPSQLTLDVASIGNHLREAAHRRAAQSLRLMELLNSKA